MDNELITKGQLLNFLTELEMQFRDPQNCNRDQLIFKLEVANARLGSVIRALRRDVQS
jgi:hypothetical protein